MQCKIANVKVSVKVCKLPLDIVSKKLQTNHFIVTLHNNFLVAKSRFTFIIFKANIRSITNHINITKIPNLYSISDAITELETVLNCKSFGLTVDNISATCNFPHKLDLIHVVEEKKFSQIKYNNQVFPGLFLKFPIGTAILFHSGKINIVGCKSEKDLEWILQNISANISMKLSIRDKVI